MKLNVFKVSITFLMMVIQINAADERNVLHIFQRTIYLENLITIGSLFANPAILSDITKGVLLSSSVLPLGYRYTLSTIRCILPVLNNTVFAAGIFGAGQTQFGRSSTQVSSESGTKIRNHFTFTRPTIQFGFARAFGALGSIGFVGELGSEEVGFENIENAYYTTMAFGSGWLSIPFKRTLVLSISTFSVFHSYKPSYWDNDAKLGVKLIFPDSIILASFEYTLSLKRGFGIATPKHSGSYEVCKGLMSIKFWQIYGFLLGVSSDLKIESSNNTCIHAGFELRESVTMPFFGGYEIGANSDLLLIHRIWIGFLF